MRYLLCGINAKYIHSNLAIYCLKAYAEKIGPAGAEYVLKEYTINHYVENILQDIYEEKADVVIFSCYIWNIAYVRELAEELKKVSPQIRIWVGGPEVSYHAERFLQENPAVDLVMQGEGEETFTALVTWAEQAGVEINILRENKPQGSMLWEDMPPGVAWRDVAAERRAVKENPFEEEAVNSKEMEKNSIHNTGFAPVMDMNAIPFVYEDFHLFEHKIIYYESSRGCPFSCSYCLSSVDKTVRFRSLSKVLPELQRFLDAGVPQVKFVDRTFNCNKQHAIAIWRYIYENDNGVTNFHFEISSDLLDEEELDLFAKMRPGLIQLEIGVQSTNPATVAAIYRKMDLDKLFENVDKVHALGNIHQHLDLIAGLPFESYEQFRVSFNDLYAHHPDQLQLGFLKVLKGSYMFEHAAEYGIVYHDKPPYEVMSTKWLSFDDVIKIKRVEDMLEVYYNSGQFEITMKLMECIFDSAFEFFQELGDFYEANGYFGMSHSRIRRCEILLEFLALYLHGCDNDAMTSVVLSENAGDRDNTDFDENAGDRDNTDFDENAQIYSMIQESLIFDLYYRENCKSRPVWATDIGSFKHMTHAYCKNGKLSHVEPFHYIFPDKHTRKLDKLPKYHKEPVWALFHYDMRDPLDHQALVEYVE